ncbi:MAG: hypothetical protein V8Q75_06315 [Bacilli bacterium]
MGTFRGTPLKLIQYLYEQDKNKVYEVKEYKEQRNNKQNSKYWKLLNELSLTLKIGVEELHFDMLKHYSQRYEILVPSDYQIRGIEYYERKSTIKKGGKEFNVYMIYTPSHELNESEFAILLQGLCEECKQVGIDTRSPEEIRKDESLM